MSIPAIIIARGGSKRLPRKNVTPLCGRSLVEWSIIQARNSHEISSVWLSSDDEEIQDIGYRNKANVIHETPWTGEGERPSGGHAVLRALESMEAAGVDVSVYINILPTCVTWRPDDFDNGIRLFRETKAESLVPKYNPQEHYVSAKLSATAGQWMMLSKNYGYLVRGEQWCVRTYDFCKRYMALLPQSDREIDKYFENFDNVPVWARFCHWYPVQWWQQYDIDDADTFSLVELLMERYILKPLGEDCYERYGNTKQK